ncbi:MAG: GntR family transcriptional regulator [Jannaschia sp.]
MDQAVQTVERRTGVDAVFDYLYAEISSMRLLPGTKISEAEIARKFDLSRQPVRDAFSRLENLDLLLIRPQKATEVKRFSLQAIETARFVRAAVEAEVLRRATRLCDAGGAARLDACLDRQRTIVDARDYGPFATLDYEFHKTLCEIGDVAFAFDVIKEQKRKIDRLCVLSLSRGDRIEQLVEDHALIARAVTEGDAEAAVANGMLHLSRLDATIDRICAENADYIDA